MNSLTAIADTSSGTAIVGEARSVEDAPDPKTTYEMFPDRLGRWRVRRLDGGVIGTFSERRTAARFVWRECRDAKRLIVTEGPLPDRQFA